MSATYGDGNDDPMRTITRQVEPLTISSANCLAVTGMSWAWVTRFARSHGVPVWRVGTRKQLVPGAPLAAAMARAAAAVEPPRELSYAEEIARVEANIAAKLRAGSR
jgi:hypothetical protein